MADTASPAKSLSTASVPPQNRMFDSDRVKSLVIPLEGTATLQRNIAFPNKVQIVGVILINDSVAQAAATNTTAINVDTEDGAGTKVADVASKAAGTAVAADALLALSVSTTEADNIVETTEILRVDKTVVGTQGGCNLVVSYVDLEVPDVSVTW